MIPCSTNGHNDVLSVGDGHNCWGDEEARDNHDADGVSESGPGQALVTAVRLMLRTCNAHFVRETAGLPAGRYDASGLRFAVQLEVPGTASATVPVLNARSPIRYA